MIEPLLIGFGLYLSIMEYDIFSQIYQLVMEYVLAIAMIRMGFYISTQRKICIIIMASLALIASTKFLVLSSYQDTVAQNTQEQNQTFEFFGFEFKNVEGLNQFNIYGSFDFEAWTFGTTFLLFIYYSVMNYSSQYNHPYGYVYHSLWFNQLNFVYSLYFISLCLDTFFAQTVTQFLILILLFLTLFAYAARLHSRSSFLKTLIKGARILLILQLAMLALTSIGLIRSWFEQSPSFFFFLDAMGWVFHGTQGKAYVHLTLVCMVLVLQQTYQQSNNNYVILKNAKIQYNQVYGAQNLEERLLDDQEAKPEEEEGRKSKKNLLSKVKDFDYKNFMDTNAPLIYLWITRILTILMAYGYFGTLGFILLTWTLLSFVLPIRTFLNFTCLIYIPIYALGFVYVYFINLEGIWIFFADLGGKDVNPEDVGLQFKNSVVEIGVIAVNLAFLIQMIPFRKTLQTKQSEFKFTIFNKMSSKRSIILWQILFYVLKKLHVLFLAFMFVFLMYEINLYFIILMFFFVIFTASTKTYRKWGISLVYFAAFFIWVNYFFTIYGSLLDKDGVFFKILTMLTFKKYDENNDSPLNEYIKNPIPVNQWGAMFCYILLNNINVLFKNDKTYFVKDKITGEEKVFLSTGDFYEDKVDKVVRNKYPKTVKCLSRVAYIMSEFMIIIILMIQLVLLSTVAPISIFFWLINILTLLIQTAIITGDPQDPKYYDKCIRYSRILKYWSGIFICLQVAYYLLTNPKFLAQYGMDEYVNKFLGPIQSYLYVIGIYTIQGPPTPTEPAITTLLNLVFVQKAPCPQMSTTFYPGEILIVFIVQILFFITATYLHDYFSQTKLDMIEEERLHQEHLMQQEVIRNLRTKAEEGLIKDEEEEIEEVVRIEQEYERVRYQIQFMIYKGMGSWWLIDYVASNFHLIVSFFVVYLAINWQLSFFTCFYLILTVLLISRAGRYLYWNSQKFYEHRSEVDINSAHQVNKNYMADAGQTLLNIRVQQWFFQYWALVLSMILMYPTPLLAEIKKLNPEYANSIDFQIFWYFWTGIYVSACDLYDFTKFLPLQYLFILLIFDKIAQRWLINRLGCTFDKMCYYKIVEEKIKCVKEKREIPNLDDICKTEYQPFNSFVTIGDAQKECERIQTHFRKPDEKERLRSKIKKEVTRKYSIHFRSGLKVLMEQISLLLLLLSCVSKCSIISIIYLFVLFKFLIMKDKTQGMIMMTYVFSVTLAVEYILTLTNLSSLNSPMDFPQGFQPYPPVEDGSVTRERYLVPWFLDVPFFRDNLNWALFFNINLEKFAINDIWFDFFNLALLSVYFLSFGNPINAQNVKVSFSQTKSLEEDLYEYSKLVLKDKAIEKRGEHTIFEETKGGKENYDDGASDSQESYLGASFYLQEIKDEIFVYYFQKNFRYIIFIGSQILTVVLILMIAILCRSLMSIGYIVAAIFLIMRITDFFNLDQMAYEGKRWLHEYMICGPLMIFSFVDIAIQIFCQIPWFEQIWILLPFGFGRVYHVNQLENFSDYYKDPNNIQPMTVLNYEQFLFLVLKSFNLFIIFLQSRIFESEGFKKFIRIELRNLNNLAKNQKKLAVTYRYNNWKIQKVINVQKTKKQMYSSVSELKLKLQLWTRSITEITSQTYDRYLNRSRQTVPEESKENITQKSPKDTQSPPKQVQFVESSLIDTSTQKHQKESKKALSMRDLFANERDPDGVIKLSKEILKLQIQELPMFTRWSIGLYRTYVNQILFVNTLQDAQGLKKHMEDGKRRIFCEIEKLMLRDIREFIFKMKNKLEFEGGLGRKIKLREYIMKNLDKLEMTRTSSRLGFFSSLRDWFIALAKSMISCAAYLTYIFMVFIQFLNAGFLTLIYPFSIFGYAMLEEERPGKKYWNFMLKYTIFLLLVKFTLQLAFVSSLPEVQNFYWYVEPWMKLGLFYLPNTSDFFIMILPEIIIMLLILINIYQENLIGLYEKREIEVESIHEARIRWMGAKQREQDERAGLDLVHRKQLWRRLDADQGEVDEYGLSLHERLELYPKELGFIKITAQSQMYKDHNDVIEGNLSLERLRADLKKNFKEDSDRFSMIDNRERLYNEGRRVEGIQEEIQAKKSGVVESFFSKNQYFLRLFPLLREQKPGIDYYSSMTLVQFIICIYLIFYYTDMDKEGTQLLENTSMFSINMTMFLFFTIFVMIFERYINKSNVKKVKRKGLKGGDSADSMIDKTLTRNIADVPKGMTMHLDPSKTQDSFIFTQSKTQLGQYVHDEIRLEETYMTFQQVCKFFLQWLLLIIYHYIIFWYFPLNSNYAIYGTPYCDVTSFQFLSYGCYEFQLNSTVQILYIIFCIYFTLSAYQIRYGLPEIKRVISFASSADDLHNLYLQLYLNVPFLLELKSFLDFTYSKTSLNFSQWLQINFVYTEMFSAQCNNPPLFQKYLGEKIDKCTKCLCGCFCSGFILVLLAGPFLAFSNSSYFAQYNLVQDATASLNMRYFDLYSQDTYFTSLYSVSNALRIDDMDQIEYEARGYDVFPETKFFQANQIQKVSLKNTSDIMWTISNQQARAMRNMTERALAGDQNISMSIEFEYKFLRPGPAEAPISSGLLTKEINIEWDQELLTQMNAAFNLNCKANPSAKQSVILKHFVYNKLHLTQFQDIQYIFYGNQTYRDLEVVFQCQNEIQINVGINMKGEGLKFITFSDLITSGFFGSTSIMAFYLGFAMLMGTYFRRGVLYTSAFMFINEIADASAILNLLDSILLFRQEGNLKKEEELYFMLLEVMRSPEMLRSITGSSMKERPPKPSKKKKRQEAEP